MLTKILKITATLTFIVALAINIDMMINDPFAGMSTEAIATDTDSGTTGTNLGLDITIEDFEATFTCIDCKEVNGVDFELYCECILIYHFCEPGNEKCKESVDQVYDEYDCVPTGYNC